MKTHILGLALVLLASSATAQIKVVDYQYKDNSFSVSQHDKMLTNKPTGKVYYSRLQAFDSFTKASLKPYLSRDQFYQYMEELKNTPKRAQMSGYGDFSNAIGMFCNNIRNLNRLSSQEDFRYRLYQISMPVHKVINESWGNDVVDAVLKEAYLNLYEYTNMMAAGDPAYAAAPKYVDMAAIKTDESKGQCQFTVVIDEPVLKKDEIEVYFSDLALFRKISKKYSGSMLEGPIAGWESLEDESDVVRTLLQAYEGKHELPAYYVYEYKLKDFGNPSTIQQNLYKDQDWFIWVFRNGTLYYSYMAHPCAKISKVTVYEERPTTGIDDAGAGTYDYTDGGNDDSYGDY